MLYHIVSRDEDEEDNDKVDEKLAPIIQKQADQKEGGGEKKEHSTSIVEFLNTNILQSYHL